MIAVARLIAALAACIAAGAVVVPGASAAANPVTSCPTIKATPWQFPHSSLKGSNYGSYVVGGFKCSIAATWIKKLSAATLKNRKLGASNVLTTGPSGFTCTANPDANGHAFAGSCRKGKGAATVGFGWASGRP